MTRIRSWSMIAALTALSSGAAGAAEVTLDGIVIPRASANMSIKVDITEFREGGEQCPRLLPGCPKPEVCIDVPAPVASLDGQLAGAATARFAVGVEDGRVFQRCVAASLVTKGGRLWKQYEYCLRCEAVTGP